MILIGQTLVDRVAGRANVTPDSGRFTTAEILTIINMVQDDIVIKTKGARYLKGRRTYETAASDSAVSMSIDSASTALDIYRIYRVTMDGEKLECKSMEWLDANFPEWESESASTGKPLYYTFVEEGIKLYPSPDGAYTMIFYFYKKPTVITVLNYPFNSIAQLQMYHQLIIPGAAWQLMQEIPEMKQERKNEQKDIFYSGLASMILDLRIEPDEANSLTFGLKNRVLLEE